MNGDRSIPVSALVLTKNEEANVAKCLRSLTAFAEVVVIDSGSSDATTDIAREQGAKVVDFRWDGRYPKKKQWSLENVQLEHDWVLYVDADEEVTPELRAEIARLFERTPDKAGYFIGLDYRFMGRVLRHGQRVYKLALFDRRRGRFDARDDLDAVNMWEVEGHYQPEIDGPVATLSGRLLHDDHDTLYAYFSRHNRYSDWEAVVLEKRGVSASAPPSQDPRLLKRLFTRLPAKPAIFFFHSYVIRGGFLDGRAGFHYAVAKAFYYWQVGIKRREITAGTAAQR